jgi:hypothetical protein
VTYDLVASLRESAEWIKDVEHESWFGTADLQNDAADEIERLQETEQNLRMYLEQDACEIERLQTALSLACGLLSTYYPMNPPDQLMQQFLEEANHA